MGKNDFLELAKKRKTVYEYSDKKISSENIKKIIEAGRWAPSSHNDQPWKFIVVKKNKTIDDLLRNCHYGGFHSKPQVLIAIVLEPIYSSNPGLLKGDAIAYAETHKLMNLGFAASNITFEAESLGINTAVISPFVKEVGKILKVPKGREVHLIISLGYEAKNAYQIPRTRKQLKEILSYEKY